MKKPPSQTFAFLLQDLYKIPDEFIACFEWQRIPSDRKRCDVQSRRRHFFNKRVSIVNYVSPETRPEEMLVDDSASTTVKQLGDALTELEVNATSTASAQWRSYCTAPPPVPMFARRSSDTRPPLNKLAASNRIRLDKYMY